MYLRAPSNLRLDADRAARGRRRGVHREADPERRSGHDRLRTGPRHRLVGGLHGQLRPAGRHHPHPAHRAAQALAPRSTPSCCGTPSPTEPHFADLRVSFDTGGMVSTALNYGASSPIDIQIDGRHDRAGRWRWPARSATGSAASQGAADVRVVPAPGRAIPVIHVNRQKAASGRPDGPRRHPAGRRGHELQHVHRPQFLGRRQERQPVLRRPCSIRKIPNATLETCSTSSPPAPTQSDPVKLSQLVSFAGPDGAVEFNHEAVTASSTCWSTPRVATSAAWPGHSKRV